MRLGPKWILMALCLVLAVPGALVAQGVCAPDLDGNIAKQMYEPDAIYWQPEVEYEQMILRVEAPCDTIEKVFRRGETPFFELREVLGPLDGSYRWELRVEPVVDPEVREALTKARDTGDYSAVRKLQDQGKLPVGPFVEGESFSVVEGRIVPPELGEEKSALVRRSASAATGLLPAVAATGGSGAGRGEAASLAPKDYVINDDLIVDGSACIGFDCVNGESFGFDTLRLKENNLRIGFDDTSTAASYPTNNWQIRANDSANGGASFLGFVDMGASGTSTGGDLVFAVEAGAPANALYVDDGGRVGFGTSTPSVELHTVDGDTPTLRFQQDGSSGFAPQTWDIAGNETNFFVRDVTNGSTLPFRIRPGAPSSSIFIDPDGNVGIGTSSPDADGLEVERTGTTTQRILLRLKNDGAPQSEYENSDNGIIWRFGQNDSGDFVINDTADLGTAEMRITTSGQVYVNGSQVHPDYVFAPDYSLMALSDLERFVAQHRHLPGVQSAAEREQEGGVNITQLPLQLLEKVEELTLYTLRQQKQIEELTAELNALRAEGDRK